MLRSLVGSEMCIRDSCVAWREAASIAITSSSGPLRIADGSTVRDDGQACLLYTSDAADDLPCVDLGGRRIIKQKKTTDTTTTYKPNRARSNGTTNIVVIST